MHAAGCATQAIVCVVCEVPAGRDGYATDDGASAFLRIIGERTSRWIEDVQPHLSCGVAHGSHQPELVLLTSGVRIRERLTILPLFHAAIERRRTVTAAHVSKDRPVSEVISAINFEAATGHE